MVTSFNPVGLFDTIEILRRNRHDEIHIAGEQGRYAGGIFADRGENDLVSRCRLFSSQ
jgi:hypothetical protein